MTGACISRGLHRVLYRAALQITGDTLRNLEVLKTQEWLPREQVDAGQQARLRRLLVHAASQVPYYRQVLAEAGVVNGAGDVHLDQFSNIPLLDKKILHERNEDLRSLDLDRRKWYRNSSGGSMGEPARFVQDQEYKDWARAVGILFDTWAGYSLGDPKFLVWPVDRDLSMRRANLTSRLGVALRNESWLDARRMTPKQMRSFLNRVHRDEPVQIYGFPENLYEIARFALEEGFTPNSPKAIVTSGTTLFSWMRRTIEAAFGAPVINLYGSREVSGIACECEAREGLHICSPIQYVEILRADGSASARGEVGEVVVTCLVNWAMPLIRYRIGDMASWAESACSCGRSWPMLQELAGRTKDLFLKRDGTRVRIVENIFYRHAWIKKFQVVQEDYDVVRAFILPYGDIQELRGTHSAGIQEIEEAILQAMGPECRVEVVLTDHIDASASGKHRYHISKVQ